MTATRHAIQWACAGGCGREWTAPIPPDWRISKRGLPWCPDCLKPDGPAWSRSEGPRCGYPKAPWPHEPCRCRVPAVGVLCPQHEFAARFTGLVPVGAPSWLEPS